MVTRRADILIRNEIGGLTGSRCLDKFSLGGRYSEQFCIWGTGNGELNTLPQRRQCIEYSRVRRTAITWTIVYLYGYSTALGANLFLYFSSSDYLRLAIEWLGPIVVVGIVRTLLGKFFTRVERGGADCSAEPQSTVHQTIQADCWWVSGGNIASLCYGGHAVIQHYVLRFILYRTAHRPLYYANFLSLTTPPG